MSVSTASGGQASEISKVLLRRSLTLAIGEAGHLTGDDVRRSFRGAGWVADALHYAIVLAPATLAR